MRELALLFAIVFALTTALVLPTTADEETVNAKVTPKVIAVTVSANLLEYSSVGVGTTDSVPDPTNVLVTNSGTVVEDFKIRGASSSPGGWTLTSSATGADTYKHKFDLSSSGSFSGSLTTANQGLIDDVAASGDVQVFFKLDMPTSTTSLVEQTLPIVITALESTASGPS